MNGGARLTTRTSTRNRNGIQNLNNDNNNNNNTDHNNNDHNDENMTMNMSHHAGNHFDKAFDDFLDEEEELERESEIDEDDRNDAIDHLDFGVDVGAYNHQSHLNHNHGHPHHLYSGHVHFASNHQKSAGDDDIPSMLMAAAAASSAEDRLHHRFGSANSNADSVMRLGFGNLNLISGGGGNNNSDVLGPLLSSNSNAISSGNLSHVIDGSVSNSTMGASGAAGGTSADLRAAIVSNWLTDHYEPQDNISLPRSVLYDHYLEFCQSQHTEPVNSATFGKIIRSVFPTLRTRRLGTRGNSKYHYFGIGLKTDFLGNDQYSSIYAQYSRPPPARPRTSRRSSTGNASTAAGSGSAAIDGSFAFGNGGFGVANHVYSAAASGSISHHPQAHSHQNQGFSASSSASFNGKSTGSGPGGASSSSSFRHANSARKGRRQNRGASMADGLLLEEQFGHGHEQAYRQSQQQQQQAQQSFYQQAASASTSSSAAASSSNGAFRTLNTPNYDDFAHFLEQICTPVFSNVPVHVPFDNVQAFSLVYQQHIIDLLRAISSHEFSVVEGLCEMFWMNFPPEMLNCLHCDESLRIIAIADDYLNQVLIHTLIPDVLEPIPIAVTQSIRQFAKFLEGILLRTLQPPIPATVIEIKLDAARRFCQVLRRRTSLSHLTQAVRSILGNTEHTSQMLTDWAHIDFLGIREQCDWIVRVKEGLLPWVEASFRAYLQDAVSLHVWAAWIESIADQCIALEQSANPNSPVEDACSMVLMRWNFYSVMIMRDLTLRSAASFGSFHLLNLLFTEYLLFSIEKRLDDHRRSVGLISFWPQQSQTQSQTVDQGPHLAQGPSDLNPLGAASAAAAAAAAFAFDDFFRKSAVLGPVSSPVANHSPSVKKLLATPNIALNFKEKENLLLGRQNTTSASTDAKNTKTTGASPEDAVINFSY